MAFKLAIAILALFCGTGWTSFSRSSYDGNRVIQDRNSANTSTVNYTRGPDMSGSLEGAEGIGGLLARSHEYSGGNWTAHNYYHSDCNGNVTHIINASRAMVASYRYDPFGNLISKSGALADVNVYRFSSKELHINSGLYYYGYRFYSPNLQRWLNQDPIGIAGGLNLYGFVYNDPLNLVDKDGRILPAIVVGLIVYFTYEAIGNAPGPESPTQTPYADAPNPIEVAQTCLNPIGTIGGSVVDAASKEAGVPPEVLTALQIAQGKFKGKVPPGPRCAAKAGETKATQLGRREHKKWEPGAGYEKEFELPSGKKVDAINFEKQHIKELKPNNQRKIREGTKQAEGYLEEVEDWLDQDNEWDFDVETYE